MNLRQIEIFRAIRSTGSISAAARQLSISQPALSKALKHAEAQLTFKLFDRVKQRLIPTFEAEALFAAGNYLGAIAEFQQADELLPSPMIS